MADVRFQADRAARGEPAKIGSVFSFAKQIIYTALEAHDRRHVEEFDYLRTVGIPTMGVRTTDFGLKPDRRDALYESGKAAAAEFLKTWDP